MKEPLCVAAVALVNEAGHVLMQQRPLASVHGGLWEFPGGKLEQGETPQRAAVRELDEELAITIDVADLDAVSFAADSVQDGSRALIILLYMCRRWSGEPQPLAAERLDWVAPENLAALQMPPLDYPLAAALREHLRR